MAIKFDRENHRKLWLLMQSNIEGWIGSKYIPTYYDAETTVDDLKASLFENSEMGDDYKSGKRPPLFYCYACQYGWDALRAINEFAVKSGRCNYCPLIGWEAENCFLKVQIGNVTYEGLFHQLCVAVEEKDIETAKALCERIAGLDIRSGVECTDGVGKVGDVDLLPINRNTATVIRRPDAFFRLPLCVYCFDNEKKRYINSEGILQVGYTEQEVMIGNEWNEDINYIFIDPIQEKQNLPTLISLAPGRSMYFERANNFDKLPITVLVEDNYNTSKTKTRFVTHENYFTVAQDAASYTIYNDSDEILSYYIMSSQIKTRVIDQLIGAYSSKTIACVDALHKRPPVVLVQDLDPDSRTYSKFISSVGYITTSLKENMITLENDSSLSLNCKLFFVDEDYTGSSSSST